jgi:3-phenylpropionate/trans-cinnamate dioxygenase ferredoxin reductase subunit
MNSINTNVAIIGNGCATISAIEALRTNGFNGKIDVLSDSIWQAYNPMLTTYYLSNKIPFESFFMSNGYSDFYSKNEVSVSLNSKITKLDTQEKVMIDNLGREIYFEKCLIASGASPFVPAFEGHDSKNVFVVRTIEDILKIKEYISAHTIKQALVVGASMVGIKVAEFFKHEGIECSLADGASHIFPLAAHANCSEIIEDIVNNNGIKLRLGASITKISNSGPKTLAYFSDGLEPEKADIIILSIGVRPNIDFISRNQIEIDRGIIVNKKMKTNAPCIYAAGDCTQGYDIMSNSNRIIGLLANARYQGRTAGRNIAGTEDLYMGNTPHNITYFLNTDFIGIGDPNAQGEVLEKYNKKTKKYIRVVKNNDKILLVNLINYKEISGTFRNLVFKKLTECSENKSESYSYEKLVDTLIKSEM